MTPSRFCCPLMEATWLCSFYCSQWEEKKKLQQNSLNKAGKIQFLHWYLLGLWKLEMEKKSFRPPIPYLGQWGGVFPTDSWPLSPAYCSIITVNNVTSIFPRSKLPHPSHMHNLVGLLWTPSLGLGCICNPHFQQWCGFSTCWQKHFVSQASNHI